MPGDTRHVDPQILAFRYLRDNARRAHAEGDGALVNSLCAVALSKLEELIKKNQLRLDLPELKWALVLPLFWLVDEYMLRAVGSALDSPPPTSERDGPLLGVLRAYHFLVQQPLADIGQQVATLEALPFDAVGDGAAGEEFVVLIHCAELVWFRSPNEGHWRKLLDGWIGRAPAWCKSALQDLLARLDLQTSLTCPGVKFPALSSESATRLSEPARLGELWIHLMNCDGERLDKSIESLGATVSPASHVARLLFDFHHFNRFHGRYGEPQERGLARRRLFTSSSPLLVFNDIRESRLSIMLASLFRRNDVGQASTRFDAFRLAMLCELSALELWDWGSWQEAIKAQSEARLEAAKWERDGALAAEGLWQAVQSVSYKPLAKDDLTRQSIALLEFTKQEALSHLVDRLLAAYPMQEYAARELLEDLGDLIPASRWVAVAEWGMRFIRHMEERKTLGSTVYPLGFMSDVIRFTDQASNVWQIIEPEVLRLCMVPLRWRGSSVRLLSGWFDVAPSDAAQRAAHVMAAAQTDDVHARYTRLALVRGMKRKHPELAKELLAELRAQAKSPLEMLAFVDSADPQLQGSAKAQAKQALAAFIAQAVPTPDSKSFSIGGSLPSVAGILWGDDDLSLLEDVTRAVNSERVLTAYVPELIVCLQQLVLGGPRSFAEYALPHFAVWSTSPPSGRDPMSHHRGPFSALQFADASASQIPLVIGWLGLQLLRKLPDAAAAHVAEWVHRSVANAEPSAIPITIYAGIAASGRLPAPARNDLVATCGTLLSNLSLRHRSEPEYGLALAEALREISAMVRAAQDPRAQVEAKASKDSLDLLLPRLMPMLQECANSTDAGVRVGVAMLIGSLQEHAHLPPALEQSLDQLARDNRACVRSEAQPHLRRIGKARDQSGGGEGDRKGKGPEVD